MSKYTVQLRYLVEQFAADHGANGIDPKNWPLAYPMLGLSGTVNTLNLPPYPVLSEDDRDRINRKIIQRYWFNEIGQETTGQFAWMLNESMNRIMPYYNQLYKAKIDNARKLLDETWDVDRTSALLRKTTSMDTGTAEGNTTATSNDLNRMLDTPQARIENLDDGYLTNASKGESKTTGSNSVSDTRNSTANLDDSGTSTESGHRIRPEQWNNIVSIGRELLNIDNMIINDMELRDCFMQIW
mgnify:CR=1 FL=1